MAKKKTDPITDKSYAAHFIVVSTLLALTAIWVVVDDMWLRRPWKFAQADYVELAKQKFSHDLLQEKKRVEAAKKGERFLQLKQEIEEAREAEEYLEREKYTQEIKRITGVLASIRNEYQDLRGAYNYYVYKLEKTKSQVWQAKLDEKVTIESLEPEQIVAYRPDGKSDATMSLEKAVLTLAAAMESLQIKQKAVKQKRTAVEEPVRNLQTKQAQFEKELSRLQTELEALSNFSVGIKQRFNWELDFVDRCHSCHVGINKKWEDFGKPALTQFLKDQGRDVTQPETKRMINMLSAHPGKYMKDHPIEKFGCTSCHQGEGRALNDFVSAHNWEKDHAEPERNKDHGFMWDDKYNHPQHHQSFPMFPEPYREAGCVQCHEHDVDLPGGERVSLGKKLIEDLGCYGCHKITGFGEDRLALQDASFRLDNVSAAIPYVQQFEALVADEEGTIESGADIQAGAKRYVKQLEPIFPNFADRLDDVVAAGNLYPREANDLVRELNLAAEQAMEKALKDVEVANDVYKPVAPDLHKIREKLKPSWIGYWLAGPKNYRPHTRMPDPLLRKYDDQTLPTGEPDPELIEPIALYLWLQADQGQLSGAKPEGDADRGEALFVEKGCVGCHVTDPSELSGPRVREGRGYGPSLARIGEKTSYGWLLDWIQDPKSYFEHSRMPDLRLGTSTRGTVSYETLENEESSGLSVTFTREDGGAIENAIDLEFSEVGEDGSKGNAAPDETTDTSVAFDLKLKPGSWHLELVERRPDGAEVLYTKDVLVIEGQETVVDTVAYDEAKDLATYLASLKEDTSVYEDWAGIADEVKELEKIRLTRNELAEAAGAAKPELAFVEKRIAKIEDDALRQKVEQGQEMIDRAGCFNCHSIRGFSKDQKIGPENSTIGSKLVVMFDFGLLHGKDAVVKDEEDKWVVSETRHSFLYTKIRRPRIFDKGKHKPRLKDRLRMPDFSLSDEEAKAIVTYLLGRKKETAPEDYHRGSADHPVLHGDKLIRKFNCRGCHEVQGRGMHLADAVENHMLDIGVPRNQVAAYLPPTLNNEGKKVQPDWLYEFLLNPITMRPWLDIRMPRFEMSEQEASDLVAYFAAVDDQEYPYYLPEKETPSKKQIAEGKHLFDETFDCASCHIVGGELPAGKGAADMAPDLGRAPVRLKPDWVEQWLRDPQQLQPGTKMPTFWDLSEPEKHLREIEAVVEYLYRGLPSESENQ